MSSEGRDLSFTSGNRKPRPEDVLHLAEQRTGMTAAEAGNRVRVAHPISHYQIFTKQGCDETIARIEQQLAALPDQQVLEAMAAAATKGLSIVSPSVIAREVATLVAAFPNAAPASPEIFISTLVYDLIDLRIPDAILVEACRRLRRTSKFLPSISEVVRAAEDLLEDWRTVEALPELVTKTRSQLEENIRLAEARLKRIEEGQTKPRTVQAEAPKKAEPDKARSAIRFATLAEAWKNDPEMLELVGRADFDLQMSLSSVLAKKGEPAARELLKRKIGAEGR